MLLDLEDSEATMLMSLINVHICQLNKAETPMETNIMEKIINARNEAIKKGAC